jgi:hypothetical protein
VELGIFTNAIPESVACGKPWVIPGKYHVRMLAQQVMQNSLVIPTDDGDLVKMVCPKFRRLEYKDDSKDP